MGTYATFVRKCSYFPFFLGEHLRQEHLRDGGVHKLRVIKREKVFNYFQNGLTSDAFEIFS